MNPMPNSSGNMDKIELLRVVEINPGGQATLGEIIEVYSSDEEGGVGDDQMSENPDIIQIDCTDQTFADLLRLNVGVTVTSPIVPTARFVSTTMTNTLGGHPSLTVVGNQPRPSTSREGTNQITVVDSQNLLQILAACTNGLVTKTNEPVKPMPTLAHKEEKRIAMVKPLMSGIRIPRRRTCLNLNCKKTGQNLKKAGFVELYYFGYPKSKKFSWICDSCDKLIGDFRKELAKAMEEKKSIYTVPTPFRNSGNVVVLDDDDDDSDSADGEEEKPKLVVPGNIGEIIEGFISKVDLQEQKKLCMDYLQHELDTQVEWVSKAELQCMELEKKLAEKKRALLASTRTTSGNAYTRTMLRPVDIDSRGVLKVLTHDTVLPPPAGAESLKRKQVLRAVIKTEKEDSDSEVVTLGAVFRPKLELSATPEPLPRVMPKIGHSVYGMKYTAKNFWLPGTLIETRKTILNTLELKIQFETTKKGRPLTDTNVDPSDKTVTTKFMNPKHIAYDQPCPFVLPVGTRVIAQFRTEDRANVCGVGVGFYFAGVVAEQPRNINAYRYLIFFDDGYAQYVGQHDVLLVCEASKEVWQDVHPDSKDFIRSYLMSYPEKAMLRLNKGSQVSMEWNGVWYPTKVVEVDSSLVKVQFERIKRVEWVYRGSSRLYPIYMKQRRLGRPGRSMGIRRNEGKIAIEYPDDDVLMSLNKDQHMARKNTSLPPTAPSTNNIMTKASIKPPIMDTANLVEFEGKLFKFKMPSRPGPRQYVEHECGPCCVEEFDPSNPELHRFTPLLQPMYFNWSREIGKYPKRHIYYKAPCGIRLRDYGELEEFLEKTHCNIGIEYFCYDIGVHPYAEFVALRQMYNIKDLSYEKENVPIQCINSIDYDYPDFVSYTSTRIPGKGVTINLDDDFLSCCDCTDNCLDKEKCSCWKLTMQGTRYLSTRTDPREIGYQQRRLHEHVISGIYECNKNCKCRSTCSNRVAQNPLKWKLQVFKTSTKGWGVRPLNDIPTGSFICAYAGQVINEVSANEDGKNQGDEYLAELDYIEVIEGFKEGYEADVVDPELDSKQQKDDPDFKMDCDDEVYYKNKLCADSDDDELGTRRPSSFNPKLDDMKVSEKQYKPTRQYFGKEEFCYIMDAKTIGNIGRYLNHSCEPNVFVQNVFVDTHDLRFPWVCFFAYKYIRAGTELTWDYNYDIGSVPGKSMFCYCAAAECRGRLL